MDRFDWLELKDVSAPLKASTHSAPRTPSDGPSFYRAARRLRMSGHFRSAAAYYERAIGFDDQNYAARVELVDTLIRARQLAEAERHSQESLENYGQVRLLYAARGLVLAHRGRFNEAFAASDISLENSEGSWYARCVRAELLLKQTPHERFDAMRFIDQAVDLAEPPWEAYLLGGWMLLEADYAVLAAGLFAEAAHQNPWAPLCWLCLGDCFYRLRFYDQALFYYDRVLELEPSHELAQRRRAQCSPRLFGLLRVFQRRNFLDRWNREFEMLRRRAKPDDI
ncbi:MAG: tetratricopeptide repeat protein [Candidatus Hydrogenedentes bacterium]|nr:tetratricopeptide repeat protein [Candidatus Hydrogenedentota bacterium]